MNSVYFATSKEQGIQLSSTKANHVANLAKEKAKLYNQRITDLSFFNKKVTLVGSESDPYTVSKAKDFFINDIKDDLNRIAQCNNLISWLREAIKAKEKLATQLKKTPLTVWAELEGLTIPSFPDKAKEMTTEDYYNSMSVKELQNYYKLENICSAIGSYIHPEGEFAKKREEYMKILNNPCEIKGEGRDTLIYSYEPYVHIDTVNEGFFDLQALYRDAQMQLNAIKAKALEVVSDFNYKSEIDYAKAQENYAADLRILNTKFDAWKEAKNKELSNIKIIIPNDLVPIYKELMNKE